MCGIAGMFDTRGTREIDRAVLATMNRTQSHRGPDGEGYDIEPGVGLAHRRLAIIDLAGGHQPLFNEDKTIAVVFNGEIYNFRPLRDELVSCGHRFATASDTEIIVHAWEEWGERAVQRFRGMFAFAVWDRPRRQLFLARDRFGVKPLFYAHLPDGMLIFGSELKAIMAHPDLPRAIDPCAVEEYFAFGYVPDPRTIFRAARKLPPGHTLTIERGRAVPEPREYWDLSFKPTAVRSKREAQDELVARLREAVAARLIADVPLGAFLSGGVDSSAVVAMMARQSAEPVTTCSIAFGNPTYDESAYAARVAADYQTRHHVEQVEADDSLSVDDLAALYDEPFADSSAIPTYRVSQAARRQVTVALSGDGGDEALAGYRRYQWCLDHARYRSVIPAMLRPHAFLAAGFVSGLGNRWSRGIPGQTTLAALSGDATDGYLELIAVARSPLRHRLFGATLRRDLQRYHAREVLRAHALKAPHSGVLSYTQYLDVKTYLPGDILTKVDRASMAHGLEVRSPFLDHTLFEWIAGLPAEWKLCRGEGKHLLKRALRPFLSADILYRPKQGFGVPIAQWLRGPRRLRSWNALNGALLNDTALFDVRVLQRLMREHESGRRDHSAVLWAALMFEAFLRRAYGCAHPHAPAVSANVA